MSDEMKQQEKKRSIAAYVLLALTIIVQLVFSTYVFEYKKQGTHSDEVWSYGLSNSYYKPFFHLNDGIPLENDVKTLVENIDNFREWVDGEQLKNYVTVQKGERFAYGSVYHNQSLDHHPPLFYFVVHTFCSFFPDTFSYYQIYFINVISMILIQIFLFKTGKLLFGSEFAALVPCAFYGASIGSLMTIIFLRQYCFITMLTVSYVYFNTRLFKNYQKTGSVQLKKDLPPLAVSAFLLFFTNYTVAAFCGVFTACMCIYLLCRKQIKAMIIYGGFTALSLGLSIAFYPYVIAQSVSARQTEEFKTKLYWLRFRKFLNHTLEKSMGWHVSVYQSSTDDIILGGIVALMILLLPLCFLFRKEEWFRKFVKNVLQSLKKFVKWLGRACYVPLFIIISVVMMDIFLAYIADPIKMGNYSARYVFMLMPLCCLASICIVYRVLSVIPKVKRANIAIALVLALGVAVYRNVTVDNVFLFRSPIDRTADLHMLTKDKNVLVIAYGKYKNTDTDNLTCAWLNTCYTAYLRDCNKFFMTTSIRANEDIDAINAENVDYIIAPVGNFDDTGDEKKLREVYFESKVRDELEEQLLALQAGVSANLGEQLIINDIIKEIDGVKGYKAVGINNIQGGDYLVIELER